MKIKGYACHWNVPNLNREIVTPESFDTDSYDAKIPVTWNHNDDIVLGHIVSFVKDDTGLFIEAELNEEVSYVKDFIQPLINDGTLDRFSTQGWIPRDQLYELSDGTYIARQFNLTAVSIVTDPADRGAVFTKNSHIFNGYQVPQKSMFKKILYII